MNLEQDVIENNKISLTEALNVQQSLSELGKKISNDDFKADAIEILIKEEIIDKGYIISDFHKYFDSNKKESPSEELWNTKKLKYFTDEFKKKNPLEKPKVEIRTLRSRENQEEPKSPESKSPRSKSNSPKRGSARKCSKQFPKITDADGEVLTEMIHVKKLESNELSESAFACVRINKAEPVKGGVFTKDYIQYKIRTNPLGWEVDRNYNDFFWLRSSLQKRYPRLIIPNIPKRQNKEKFSEDSVRKRIYIFERFLNDCLTDENLKADSILCDFLSADDIDKFKNIKDKVDKLPRQTRVEDMWSHDGHLSVDLRPELSEYSKIAETYCGQTEPVLKEIRHLSKRLASEIKQVSTTIKEIGQKFELLQGFSSFYNQKISRDENSLDTIYSSLQRTFYTWGEKMQDQVNLVKKSLVCFFKYNSYENEFYREVNIRRTKLEEEYSQHKQALIAKKDKLFKQGDVNKWDLDPIKSRDIPRTELISDQSLAFDVMLYGETEDLRRKRDMYGVINSSVSREMVKILKRRCISYQENFKNFANKQLEFANEMDLNWTSFATDMDKLKLSMSRIIN